MTLKSLLSLYSGQPYEDPALAMSMALAATFTAEVRFVRIEKPLFATPELVTAYGQSIDQSLSALSACGCGEAGLADCNDLLDTFAKRYGVAFDRATHVAPPTTGPRASFKAIVERPAPCLDIEGRCCDMIIAGHHSGHSKDETGILMSAIFETGRPVMIVPEKAGFASRRPYAPACAAVAWDGSLESARALASALPLLTGTPAIRLLCGDAPGAHPTAGETDAVTNWLHWHGHRLEVERLTVADDSVGQALVARAGAIGADLLIAGAYGHSHSQDMLLGQTTRQILENVEIPLLVSN